MFVEAFMYVISFSFTFWVPGEGGLLLHSCTACCHHHQALPLPTQNTDHPQFKKVTTSKSPAKMAENDSLLLQLFGCRLLR